MDNNKTYLLKAKVNLELKAVNIVGEVKFRKSAITGRTHSLVQAST